MCNKVHGQERDKTHPLTDMLYYVYRYIRWPYDKEATKLDTAMLEADRAHKNIKHTNKAAAQMSPTKNCPNNHIL